MSGFTPTQGRCLAYIHGYTDGFGLPPASSEIADAPGVSVPSVSQMLKTLEKKGLIQRQPNVRRSIEILIDPDMIPKWRGKQITRTVLEWVQMPEGANPNPVAADIYRLKITLLQTSPPIWRRIETTDTTLATLHELIQTSMGWTDSHLHEFEVAGSRYADARFEENSFGECGAEDYADVRLSDLVAEHGPRLKMRYTYDFGDGWEHAVTLEAVSQAEARVQYPRCIAGARACPPEDVGGVYGFLEFVAAITDPSHSEHEEMLEWSGPFGPAAFDPEQATREMKQGLPTW